MSAQLVKRSGYLRNAVAALLSGTRFGAAFNVLFPIRQQARRFSNRYEAAMPSGPGRSWLPGFVRDAWQDSTSYTRWEMTRKIRYFQQNLWLVRKLQEVHQRYSVGPNGLQIIPASSDHAWNQRMRDAFAAWSDKPGRESRLCIGQIHQLIAGERHIDGEVFVLKTWRKDSPSMPAIPAVQLIESHRVSSPGHEFSSPQDAPELIDGVQLEKESGRPYGYWVRDSLNGSEWKMRKAEDVLHVYQPERIGMYRGITPYHAVLLTGHDLDDLEWLEMQRAKINATIANVITTASGEMPENKIQELRQLGFNQSAAPTGSELPADEELNKRLQQYSTELGAKTISMKMGEDIKQLVNESPSAAVQWFWKYKIGQVCSSMGVPMFLVLPETDEAGTITRALLDDAHLGFRTSFYLYAGAALDIYRHFARWAIYNLPEVSGAPADWARAHVIPPRAVNVDFGRNSKAMLDEYAAGTISLDDIAGMNGTTAEDLIYKKARNVGQIKQIAERVSSEMGVEIKPEEICKNLAEAIVEAKESSDEDDKEEGEEIADADEVRVVNRLAKLARSNPVLNRS